MTIAERVEPLECAEWEYDDRPDQIGQWQIDNRGFVDTPSGTSRTVQ